jgi:hypothetical protein
VENATPTIPQQLGQLHRDLEVASETYRARGEETARQCAELALGSVVSFLQGVFDGDSQALLPLRRLQYALHDLDRGQVDPLLRPKKIDHRPPSPLQKEGFIAFVAAAMELFVDGGVPRAEAARRVAQSLHARGYRYGRGHRITPRQIERWRDKMRAGSALDNPAVERFRRIVEQWRHQFRDTEQAAETILERLPLVVPPEIPLKPGA